MNASMLRAGELTVSPAPGTREATPYTQISLLGVEPERLSQVVVTGSQSGAHAGTLRPYSQGDGASFVLAKPLIEGEQVTVKLRLAVSHASREVGWRFTVGRKAGLGAAYSKTVVAASASVHARANAAARADATGSGRIAGQPSNKATSQPPLGPVQSYRSQPNLHPPDVFVVTRSSTAQPGYIFMSPFTSGQAGPMILNDSGQVVWFHPVNTGPLAASKAADLQVQRYDGEPVLTWWEDPLKLNDGGRREPQDVIYDDSYRQVATVRAGNGLVPDVHEFQITPEGTALLAIKHDVACDLGKIDGTGDGSVWDDVIQEVDVATGLVRWEWNSLDHVALAEAHDSAKYATASYPYDFFHLNSIEPIEGDGLLVSARDTWAMYDVDRQTGELRWRLGGKRSNFAMGAGTRTAWQHDARVAAPAPAPGELLISVFDNGAVPQEHPQSRGVIELLNLDTHTATLERELTHSPALLAGSQGSVESIGDGDTVVGWGQKPWVTEYEPSGGVSFDAHLAPVEQSYRALRYEWQGRPATPPKIALESLASGKLAVYASWNGATVATGWNILEGTDSRTLKTVSSGAFSGFETRIEAPLQKGAKVVEAQAVGAGGKVLATSATTAAPES
ncbi:MAG: arylsulfotransferase family protein [Solirubrobacteraceae bacterium]